MKQLLARLSRQKALGVLVDDQEIAVSQVAATPLGPVELYQHREPVEPNQQGIVLARLLTGLLGPRMRRRMPLTLGLPASRVFFTTRPIRKTSGNLSPQVLLREALQSPNIAIDDMVMDFVKATPDKRPVASLVACRKKHLTGVQAVFEKVGLRHWCAEPMPCALLRAAACQHRAPRRAKHVLRIFLNDKQALAVVATADSPIIWRLFDLRCGEQAAAIRSMIRSLQVLLPHCGIEAPLNAVMVHGRADLRDALGVEAADLQTDLAVTWHADPKLAPATVAFGLALAGLKPNTVGYDLAQTFRPRATFREIVPWGEVALQATLLAALGSVLGYRCWDLHDDCRAVQAQNAQRPWAAAVPLSQLEHEKKDLQRKLEAIEKFSRSRTVWTSHLQDVSSCLPKQTSLSTFHGTCELETSGKARQNGSKPKKSLILCAETPLRRGGTVPQEIDGFLSMLRSRPALKHDFAVVELAEIKASEAASGGKSLTSLTVVCLPKADKKANKGPAANGKDKPAE
jgi:hypothetical protein